ncbi:LacI family DNA-binding transcriptional regulator [Cellulosimicrobium sp. 22601]|uniref:LacI family DNA-binding transcriptional regulator n=1 Tax=unclassified Cellulosimicrobium TaxID=2624466 RepID=UPI003F83AC9E
MTTIRDVARVAGVSPATVSRVVNGLPGYSEVTRKRVERAAADLGYEPDTLARGLKTRQSAVIGVLTPVVSDALASEILRGVEDAAQSAGHTVMLGRTGAGAVHAPGYLRTFRTYRAAGVVLISAAVTAEMRRALGEGTPFIAVAIRDGRAFPSIAIDDEKAAYDGTRYLLGLGHRKIGLLGGDITSHLVNTPRLRGYERAMREMRLEPHIAHGNSLYESAPAALAALLDREPALTAVFALSDEMAAATVNELQRQGRRVPEDVSVLGFDNTRTAVHVQPALTTVAQPLRKMGELAVERLLGTGPSTRMLDHRIIERGTVVERSMPDK